MDDENLNTMFNVKELMIDSIISAKNLFLNNITKKFTDPEDLLEYKIKIKLNSEYKDSIKDDNIRPNRYNDKLSFREEKKIEEKLLNKKSSRLLEEKSVSLAPYEDKILKEEINTNLNNIPDKYKINTDDYKNDNLVLSLYKNQNHITFRKNKLVAPEWHPPWKLYRVISGHTGWVRCIDVDPTNNWFVTGSNDRVIKFWDLATGKLKLSLTGHINTVRSVIISPRHPYLFSCGEDKQIKCWDLEQNKVVRHYHGHLSGVYCMTLHPTLDIIATGGRDCVVRMWDIRTKNQIFVMEGHNNSIGSIQSQEFNPQIISGSHDATIKLWDITAGKCFTTLTHHKKSIRSLIIHDQDFTFLSGII